ncbi:hypothetical protein F5X99DRAFT_420717 [Biscogniauxia marginata]|nr:hypothetical protein F5X99DRAFT_420717 [Biscogniauxia marginata]
MVQLLLYFWSTAFLANIVRGVDTSSLRKLLSPESYISNRTTAPRWSDYKAPQPAVVIHPASESDVQITVKWAVERKIPFLAQSGGNGWATTFTLKKDGVIIDLDLLRAISFSASKKLVTVGGGALVSDVAAAGSQNSALVTTGTCDCVSTLGALLGGGIGYLTGEYGLGVDNVVSMNVVLADGTLKTVTAESSSDLFWALRGAAPNFGIVTSAVLVAHPVNSSNPSTAWEGALIYTPAQLDPVLDAIANLTLASQMALSMTWVLSDSGTPTIIVNVFYHSLEAAGRAAFNSLLAISPVSDRTAITPYAEWNAGATTACMSRLDPASWHAVYNVWAGLVKQAGVEHSSVLLNAYPMGKARKLPLSSSAYPFRDTISYFASITVLYTDPAFDGAALTYGRRARVLWQGGDGLAQDSTYINNAFGDEPLETIYGASLSRLQTLKRQNDPQHRFNQWFPLL